MKFVLKQEPSCSCFTFGIGVKMKKQWQAILLVATLTALTMGTTSAADTAKKVSASAPASASSSASVPASGKTELIDLNNATKKELATLPKIGDVRSDAIIKGRPYKGKDELLSKKILPEDVYNGIKDLVIARQKPAEKK
ncbi:ComEA family DNA-binding protein [Undibacterium sp. Di27W]|uniref:ComEA family DNA-binding protein n=1 Tax=Undibacterium sp. Di27W TaxID=3413036 RepID=UPI003BF22DD5